MGYNAINSHARWGTDGASISWDLNCSKNITGVQTTDNKILLMQIDNTDAHGAQDIKPVLQYSKDGETFTTLTDATNWIYQNAQAFSDGDATTSAECTVPSGNWTNGIKDENNSIISFNLNNDEYTECLFSIRPSNASAGGTYRFRTYDTAESAEIPIGGNLPSYIQAILPSITSETVALSMGQSKINIHDSNILISNCAVKDEIVTYDYIHSIVVVDYADKIEALTSQIINTPIIKLTHKDIESFKNYILFSKLDALAPHLSGNVPRSTFLTDLDISTLQPSSLIEKDNYTIVAGIDWELSLSKTKSFIPSFLIDPKFLTSKTLSGIETELFSKYISFSKTINEEINIPFIQRGLDFVLSSDISLSLTSLNDILLSFILSKKDAYILEEAVAVTETIFSKSKSIIPFITSDLDFTLERDLTGIPFIDSYEKIETIFTIEQSSQTTYLHNLYSTDFLDYKYIQTISEKYGFDISLTQSDALYSTHGLDFDLSLTQSPTLNIVSNISVQLVALQGFNLESLFSFISHIKFNEKSSFEEIINGLLSLSFSKFLNQIPNFILDSNLIGISELELTSDFSELQRGLQFAIKLNKEVSTIFSIDYLLVKELIAKSDTLFHNILFSLKTLFFTPSFIVPIGLTTLSLAKTKTFKTSLSIDNILSYTDNFNFDYNSIQDYGIDLNVTQIFSEIFTLIPLTREAWKVIKEILVLAKQIELITIVKQLSITTTA